MSAPIATQPYDVSAIQLNGTHRDLIVCFHWRFPSGVQALVIGDLREVHHDSEGVTIWVAPHDSDLAEKSDFLVPGNAIVTVHAQGL